jgi:hypothetical protein
LFHLGCGGKKKSGVEVCILTQGETGTGKSHYDRLFLKDYKIDVGLAQSMCHHEANRSPAAYNGLEIVLVHVVCRSEYELPKLKQFCSRKWNIAMRLTWSAQTKINWGIYTYGLPAGLRRPLKVWALSATETPISGYWSEAGIVGQQKDQH